VDVPFDPQQLRLTIYGAGLSTAFDNGSSSHRSGTTDLPSSVDNRIHRLFVSP